MRYGKKAENALCLPPLFDMAFGQVKAAQMLRPLWEWAPYFEWLRAAGVAKPEAVGVFELQRTALWLGEELERIDAAEAKLSGHPTNEEKAADASSILALGAFVQFSELADGNVLRIPEIERAPYATCFAELKKRHEMAQYQKRLTKIIHAKK
jgi:hypothetical protein